MRTAQERQRSPNSSDAFTTPAKGAYYEVEGYLNEANDNEGLPDDGPGMTGWPAPPLNGHGPRHKHSSNGDSIAAPLVPASIIVAVEKSMAATLLPRFSKGYRQMLGRRFEGGFNLSGGEWQKVALARAYIRDAQVLILDEPTAALDARAEFEAFNRFAELVRGRLALLISHRFSTVRMADRIIVLQAEPLLRAAPTTSSSRMTACTLSSSGCKP